MWELLGLPSVSFRHPLKFSHSSIDLRPFFSQPFSNPVNHWSWQESECFDFSSALLFNFIQKSTLKQTFTFTKTFTVSLWFSLSLSFQFIFHSHSHLQTKLHSHFLFYSYFTFIFIQIFTFTFIFSIFPSCSTPAACCRNPSRLQTRRGSKLFSRLRN